MKDLMELSKKITNRFINNLRGESDEDIEAMRDGLDKFVYFEISKLAIPAETLVSQAAPQAVPTCGHCVDCKHYEKIDDTEPGNIETFWEQCKHKEFNEMLVWDCEKTGCTNFESK